MTGSDLTALLAPTPKSYRKTIAHLTYYLFVSVECGDLNARDAAYLLTHPRAGRTWVYRDTGIILR
ncbi:MAG: hypothetical protein KKD77_20800 [Gammaproteobacteria bacterium]|nr:hypothetical protein [Gammaproteobacteria bacterium]